MKRVIFIIAAVLISTSSILAQKTVNIQYSMSIPHGATRHFSEHASFKGFLIEGKDFIDKHVAVGGFIKWNAFSDKVIDDIITIDNQTSIGNSYRYINTLPIMASVSYYYFKRRRRKEPLTPYATLAAGTIYQSQVKKMGSLSTTNKGFMIGLAPEIGICYIIPKDIDIIPENINIIANYQYIIGFETSNVPLLSYSSLNIGIGVTF